MYRTADLRLEAQEALERLWFVQSIEETERTARILSLRLYIRPTLLVQVFLSERSSSPYLALIQAGQRIFGIDREAGEWHAHPYAAPDQHDPLPEGLEPKPLLSFLAWVEDLLLEHELL